MVTENSVPSLTTPGVMAKQLGKPLHRILYVLRTRQISPLARAGTLRLYDREAINAVSQELNAIDRKRGEGDNGD